MVESCNGGNPSLQIVMWKTTTKLDVFAIQLSIFQSIHNAMLAERIVSLHA